MSLQPWPSWLNTTLQSWGRADDWIPAEDRGGGLCHIWRRDFGGSAKTPSAVEWIFRDSVDHSFLLYRQYSVEGWEIWHGPQLLSPNCSRPNFPTPTALTLWWSQKRSKATEFLQSLMIRLLSDSQLTKEKLSRLGWLWWVDRPLRDDVSTALEWHRIATEDISRELARSKPNIRYRAVALSHITSALIDTFGLPTQEN